MTLIENWLACRRAEPLFRIGNSFGFQTRQAWVVVIGSRIEISELRQVLQELTLLVENAERASITYDLRGLDFREIDSATIRQWLRTSAEFKSLLRTNAVFVVENELGFGMMRMFQLLADADSLLPETRTHVTYSVYDAVRRIRYINRSSKAVAKVSDGGGGN